MINDGLWFGMRIGGKTGAILALLYSSPIVIPLLVVPYLGVFVLLIALMTGVLFGTIIGLITGATIGWLINYFQSRITQREAIVASVGVAVLIGSILNAWLWLDLHSVSAFFSWFMLGIPSVIYVVVSGWIGVKVLEHLREAPHPEIAADRSPQSALTKSDVLMVLVIFSLIRSWR